MKTLLNFLLLISITSFSNNTHNPINNEVDLYTKKMNEAMLLWKQNKVNEAAGLFERIAAKEKENWLPYYYACLVYVTNSFNNPNKKQVTINLKKAQDHLNEAEIFTDNTVEITVAKAFLMMAEMMIDPQNRAHTMAPKIEKLYMEAIALNPKNPRAVAGLADWKYGEAKWMNQDTTPYCQAFEKALLLFDNDTPTEPFGPTWGKDRVQRMIALCNK